MHRIGPTERIARLRIAIDPGAIWNCPGFQCPTVEQDAEQNALLKAILFTPWSCTNPMTCGNFITYKCLLSNGTHPDANLTSAGSDGTPPPPACSYTFKRAWRLRSAEIHVLADRAQCRCMAARKRLVLADTTLFADMKEPKAEIENGEEIWRLLVKFYRTRLRRSAPGHGVRQILAFAGLPC